MCAILDGGGERADDVPLVVVFGATTVILLLFVHGSGRRWALFGGDIVNPNILIPTHVKDQTAQKLNLTPVGFEPTPRRLRP